MTEATKTLIAALAGHERERCEFDNHEYPIDDPFAWGDWNGELRYRWAALAALENGDTATAAVLAQLAMAASTDHLGLELMLLREGAE